MIPNNTTFHTEKVYIAKYIHNVLKQLMDQCIGLFTDAVKNQINEFQIKFSLNIFTTELIKFSAHKNFEDFKKNYSNKSSLLLNQIKLTDSQSTFKHFKKEHLEASFMDNFHESWWNMMQFFRAETASFNVKKYSDIPCVPYVFTQLLYLMLFNECGYASLTDKIKNIM